MAGTTFQGQCWLLVLTGVHALPFQPSIAPLAATFPWSKAIPTFVLALVIMLLVLRAFNIYVDSIQGTAIWYPSSTLLTIVLLWLFGAITGSTVIRILICALWVVGGFVVISFLLTSVFWRVDRGSRRSKDSNGE